jgi:hypothetical protein
MIRKLIELGGLSLLGFQMVCLETLVWCGVSESLFVFLPLKGKAYSWLSSELLAQNILLYFTHGVARQFVHEMYVLRHFEIRQFSFHFCDDVSFR